MLSLCSEAFRRAVASPVRVGLLTCAAVVMFAVMLASELAVVSDIESFRRQEMWQGRGIALVQDVPFGEQELLRESCNRIGAHSGVVAAGGFREPEFQSLATYPGTGIRLASLDEAVWQMWYPGSAGPETGVAAGVAIVERLGLLPGDPVRLQSAPERVLRIETVTGQGRPFAQADNWLIEPAAVNEPIEVCWVDFGEPVRQEHLDHLAASVGNLSAYRVSPVIRTNELSRNPSAEFAGRWTQWGPLATITVLALLYAMILHSRKGEQAVYVTVGLNRAEAYLMSLVEVGVAVVVPGILSSAVALYVHNSGDHEAFAGVHRLAVDSQMLTLLVVWFALPLLAALQPRSSLFDDLKSQ